MHLVFILSVLYFENVYANLSTPPEVTTPLGKVQGEWRISYDGRQYAAFLGIPYAKPPIGTLRFEEPQPIEPWIGIWNATQSYICVQRTLGPSGTIIGNEDCLYINVFIPDTNEEKLDVVVHIHGGGFAVGSGLDYLDPKYVMDRDIVFVTFNYRLGALGFLSTEDPIMPGNNGLKDQVLALKWVQQNIASFGGEPNSITLNGFSAGAASVHLHYFSPLSKGLFHRGWSMSGTATNDWAISINAAERAKNLATLVGCPSSDSKNLVECLKTRPASLLLQKTKHLAELPLITIFAPTVDNMTKKPFLLDHPRKLLLEKNVLDVPWITSVTRNEGIFVVAMSLEVLREINANWTKMGPYFLYSEKLVGKNDVLNKIREFYLGEEPIDVNASDKLGKMLTDSLMMVNGEATAKLQASVTKSLVYFYLFNYDEGENNFMDEFPERKWPGVVAHGDDMIYFFGGMITKKLSESDVKLKNACLDMLYSYAKHGVPSFKGVDWLPTSSNELTFLNITRFDNIKLQTTRDLTATRKFWEGINIEENIIKTEL